MFYITNSKTNALDLIAHKNMSKDASIEEMPIKHPNEDIWAIRLYKDDLENLSLDCKNIVEKLDWGVNSNE